MAKKNEDATYILNSKMALPNKLLQDDGTTTDIAGNIVVNPVEAYDNKPALPNKFLNPDGTYSTLNEIIASMVDTSIYVIVDELPAEGNPQKIYLVPDGKGSFVEYHWTGEKWDPIGMIEFDLSNYSTTQEMMNAIEASALQTLNASKTYTNNAVTNFMPVYKWDGSSSQLMTILNQIINKNITKFAIYFEGTLAGGSGAQHEGLCVVTNFNTSDGVHSLKFITNNNNTQSVSTNGVEFFIWAIRASYTCENGQIVSTTDASRTMISDSTLTYRYLPTDNDATESINFTPTLNMHPATKKYVDDSIVNNITNVLGGEY